MDERKVTSEELCKALRCSAGRFQRGTDLSEYCKGCPYDMTEEPRDEFKNMAEMDGLIHWCNVDQMAVDAADRIEELTAKVKKATDAIREAASKAELCDLCARSFSENAWQFCEDCDWDNFEWKE